MRNPNALHIDFSALTGMLGKVVPSDIDMVYERKGMFLVGEWKRDGEQVSKGQELLLKALARKDEFTVLIINGWTENGSMTVKTVWSVFPSGECVAIGQGLDFLKDYIAKWYQKASSEWP